MRFSFKNVIFVLEFSWIAREKAIRAVAPRILYLQRVVQARIIPVGEVGGDEGPDRLGTDNKRVGGHLTGRK